MPNKTNTTYLIIGVLLIAVGALSYKLYDDNQKPKGVQLNIGPAGISVK